MRLKSVLKWHMRYVTTAYIYRVPVEAEYHKVPDSVFTPCRATVAVRTEAIQSCPRKDPRFGSRCGTERRFLSLRSLSLGTKESKWIVRSATRE